MDGCIAPEPEHHQTLGEAAVKKGAFTAPGFDDECEDDAGGDEFDDPVDAGGEERCCRARKAERGEYFGGVVVDRVRPGPLLEKGEEAWDEATEGDDPVLPHLAELCPEIESVTTDKVRADFGEGELDRRRKRVGTRNIGEGFCCVFIAFFLDKPTRRFWLEKHKDKEENTWDDLNDNRKTPLRLSKRDLNRYAVVDPN